MLLVGTKVTMPAAPIFGVQILQSRSISSCSSFSKGMEHSEVSGPPGLAGFALTLGVAGVGVTVVVGAGIEGGGSGPGVAGAVVADPLLPPLV